MFRTLAIVAVASFIIAAVCIGGAAALAGPDLAKSGFWRDFDWENFEWEDSDELPADALAVTQVRDVTGFTSVSTSAGIRTEITIGPAFHVEVVSAAPDRVVTEVLGERLNIESQHMRGRSWWRNNNGRRALVRVTMPAIEAASSSAGAMVAINGVAGGDLDLSASSGSMIEASGACAELDAEASSGAHVDAEQLTCQTGSAEASSGGRVEVNVTGQLDVDASSGGTIDAKGAPQIRNISLSSGGSLDRD